MGQGAAFYPGGSGQRMTGGLSTTKFSYDSLKKKPTNSLDSVWLFLF
jgi:conjugal transfer pilus assembly protein TraB